MPTCRPLVRCWAASSASLRNATMSKKSVSSRLNGRSTAIEKFATAMPDWLYRRSGSRVSLPTKATRFTVPLLQIPVGQSVPSYQRLLLDVSARHYIRHHVCFARLSPLIDKVRNTVRRWLRVAFACRECISIELGESVFVAGFVMYWAGIVDETHVIDFTNVVRALEITPKLDVVVDALTLVAALGSAISGPCGLRLRGILHRCAIREPCLEDVGYIFARFRDHSAAQCFAAA